MNAKEKKRGPGRPSICGDGLSPVLRVRLHQRHLAALDRLILAGRAGNRSEALRWIMERAIDLAGLDGAVTEQGGRK